MGFLRAIALALLFGIGLCLAGQERLILETRPPIFYPPIARIAGVQGYVRLHLTVDKDGSVREVTVVSGPQMLHKAASDFASGWKLAKNSPIAGAHEVVIHFVLVEPDEGETDSETGNTTVRVISPELIEVRAVHSTQNYTRTGCPRGNDRLPPPVRLASDYVETGWPLLRVESSGLVLWDPPGEFQTPDWTKAMKGQIESSSARDLIEKFRTSAFWSMCQSYDISGCDFGSTELKASLGGVERHVHEYGPVAPAVFDALLTAIHEATNSHQWRVGDPRNEQMGDMGADVWLPKPGRTALMGLVNRGELEKSIAALEAGASVNARDESGWTPLMYAAGGYGKRPTAELLSRGAPVGDVGRHGETALMFGALTGTVDEDLLKAGADPNAKTDQGVTALMLLAEHGDAETLRKLITAGAKAELRDAKGRSALDYLFAASCGQELVLQDSHPFVTVTLMACTRFDTDDLTAARDVLLHAGANATRTWVAAGTVDVNP